MQTPPIGRNQAESVVGSSGDLLQIPSAFASAVFSVFPLFMSFAGDLSH
jgi:hypothetical protein